MSQIKHSIKVNKIRTYVRQIERKKPILRTSQSQEERKRKREGKKILQPKAKTN
jgi:hypothetical protein